MEGRWYVLFSCWIGIIALVSDSQTQKTGGVIFDTGGGGHTI